MKNDSQEQKCWACHKTIVGKAHFGLCSACANKYGTPVVSLFALAGGGIITFLGKNVRKKEGVHIIYGCPLSMSAPEKQTSFQKFTRR